MTITVTELELRVLRKLDANRRALAPTAPDIARELDADREAVRFALAGLRRYGLAQSVSAIVGSRAGRWQITAPGEAALVDNLHARVVAVAA